MVRHTVYANIQIDGYMNCVFCTPHIATGIYVYHTVNSCDCAKMLTNS